MGDPDRVEFLRAIHDNSPWDKQILSDALMALGRDQRTVVVRAYYLGQAVADIAAAERIPEGIVMSRLHDALHAMRNTFRENGEVA